MSRPLLLALLVTVLPSVGSAQDVRDRLRSRLDGETLEEVQSLVDRARREGLPVEPLVQKALEGSSKGASGPRLVAAVGDLLRRLGRASEAFGEEVSESELVAGAGAIHVGVSPATLTELRHAHEDVSLAVPLVVLTDMIRKGVATETASDVILSLVRARVDDVGLRQFRQQLERDIGLGAPPGEAALVRARGAMLLRRPRIPRDGPW